MAEAVARKLGPDVMEPSSAGFTPLGRVEALTIETLTKNHYPAEGLRSKGVQILEVMKADLIVNLSGRPGDVAFEAPGKVEDWDVEDPYGADAGKYQRIFEEIERRVAELTSRLRKAAQKANAERPGQQK